MNREKIPFEKIVEIAQEVTPGYNPKGFPSLEKISWAFPVEGKDKVYYNRMGYLDRIPNTQEGNAMRQLMTFKNLHNILSYLSEGKTSHGAIPHHTFPVGDAEDGAYMVYSYLRQRDAIKGKEGIEMQKGLFWELMPEGLVKTMLRVEGTGRGKIVDEWGNEIEQVGSTGYVDENLTREYLQNIRQASELGKEHFQNLLQMNERAGEYNQLVIDLHPEIWTPGTEFQWAFYNEEEPQLMPGKVIRNSGDKIEFASGDYTGEKGIERLRMYGEKGMLWRVVPGRKHG